MNQWGPESILNFRDYSVAGIALNLICASLWAVSYLIIIHRIRKDRFLEMPIFAAFGNISWELLWSTHFQGNLGELFNWGVRLWLILDVYIVWHLFKLGHQQVFVPLLKRHFKLLAGICLVGWTGALYAFPAIGIDNPIGGRSAIILNLVISVLYVFLFLRTPKPELMSRPVAWCKGIGTACYTASVFFNHGPQDIFIECIGVLILAVDASYIALLYRYKSGLLALPTPLDVASGQGESAAVAKSAAA